MSNDSPEVRDDYQWCLYQAITTLHLNHLRLCAKVDSQEARIEALERRVVELEEAVEGAGGGEVPY